MIDLGTYIKSRIEARALDLNAPFAIELSGRVTKDGRIDPATAKYTRDEGNKEMVEAVKKAIEAINVAGYFIYVSELSITGLRLRAEQTDASFIASMTGEVENESKASTIVTALRALVMMMNKQVESGNRPADDDLKLFKSMTASSEGKNVHIALELPKAEFQGLLKSSLRK